MKTLLLGFMTLNASLSYGAIPSYDCKLVVSNMKEGVSKDIPVGKVALVAMDDDSASVEVSKNVKAYVALRNDGELYSLSLNVSKIDSKGYPRTSLSFSQASLSKLPKKLNVGGSNSKTGYALVCTASAD